MLKFSITFSGMYIASIFRLQPCLCRVYSPPNLAIFYNTSLCQDVAVNNINFYGCKNFAYRRNV